MKKTIILLSLVSIELVSCFSPKKLAQSKMADPKDHFLVAEMNYNPAIISQLKATTTVFFYDKSVESKIDSLKQAIKSGWDLTPIIFDDINNFNKYASDKKYSYFVIEGYTITSTSMAYSSANLSGTHYYLTLRLSKEAIKKGDATTYGLCRIELYPNFQTMNIVKQSEGNNSNDIITKLYKDGIFYNWTPILMKAQLEAVSSNLKKYSRPSLIEEVKNKNLSQMLSNDTLYVPKSLLIDFAAFSGKEKDKEDNIFQKYNYKYRICTDSELFDIFETQKRGRFLFEYVKSVTDKLVTIYDLKEKNIVYRKYTTASYNLKSSDIEKIK